MKYYEDLYGNSFKQYIIGVKHHFASPLFGDAKVKTMQDKHKGSALFMDQSDSIFKSYNAKEKLKTRTGGVKIS